METPSGTANLRVDDDGAGIPHADRQRVFERFVRLDEARTRDTGGSGLGLAIVAEIIKIHGGTVTIGDSPLGGASVEVVLPAHPD
jgi:signal transduction histidine kinase